MPNVRRIKELLEGITPVRIEQIRGEILRKEQELVHEAEHGDRLDETHKLMVLNNIRDNLIPQHPQTIGQLMLQFFSSASSYSVLREYLRRQFLLLCHQDRYPILDDFKLLLYKIFNKPLFQNDATWDPIALEVLAKEIQTEQNYNLDSREPLPRIVAILVTAPPVIQEIFGEDINQKYHEIEGLQNIPDAFERANSLWRFAENVQKHNNLKIKHVGTALVCDFLKESGFKNYAKIDFQMINAINNIIGEGCRKFNNFELFVATQWISQQINITPFKLDKILYVYGWMNGRNNRR